MIHAISNLKCIQRPLAVRKRNKSNKAVISNIVSNLLNHFFFHRNTNKISCLYIFFFVAETKFILLKLFEIFD